MYMRSQQSVLVWKYFLSDFLREIVILPFWWYTIGFARTVAWCARSIKGAAQTTGLTIWAQNLFVPMYGETTFSGKAISFFIRLIMVIARGLATLVWMVVAMILLAIYLVALPVAALGILYHGFGMMFV